MKPKQKHQENDKDGKENERVMMLNLRKEGHYLWEERQTARSV
jgi:hypothetical protein